MWICWLHQLCWVLFQGILKGQNRLVRFLSKELFFEDVETNGEVERPLLVEKKQPPIHVDINTCNTDGATPLILATLSGHIDVVYTLLQYSANVRYSDLKGWVLSSVISNVRHNFDLYFSSQKHSPAHGSVAESFRHRWAPDCQWSQGEPMIIAHIVYLHTHSISHLNYQTCVCLFSNVVNSWYVVTFIHANWY